MLSTKNVNGDLAFSALGQKYTGTTNYAAPTAGGF